MSDTKYKPVIGLEIHAHLNTKTKMFCDSLNDPDEKTPNTNICPICTAHPGSLPVINEEAVKKVILSGLALNCQINPHTFFERKNYFYPDLPKGYQISQYQKPFCNDGQLTLNGKKFRIKRIHLEEDAGRLYHPTGADYSLVDFNRAGAPLMELVTEPDFESGAEVKAFAEELQMIFRYLNVSYADMEKGLMRVEVNISLTNPDGSWGTKVEIKNLNSIKAAADSVNYEIKRQKEVLEKGERVVQETRGWDDNKKATVSQRLKEEARDYRYFPEPDLPPVELSEPYIEEIKSTLVELPSARRARFKEQYQLPGDDIEVFTVNKKLGDFFEHVASQLLSLDNQPKLFKLASNYLITELQKHTSGAAALSELKFTPESFADLIVKVSEGEISSSAAQIVLEEMYNTGKTPETIIQEKDLGQVSDSGVLEEAVNKVIAANPKAVADFKKGKEASLKFLIGAVMRESKGKANPQVVEEMIRKLIK